MPNERSTPDRLPFHLATLSASLFVCFLLLLAVLHLLRPDYTVTDHMISDYAVGRFGWLMTLAFLAVAFGCLALGIGLWRCRPRSPLHSISAMLLIVAFAGLVVTAAFPTDLETAPSTREGDIHALSFLVNIVSLTLAAICLALGCVRSPNWRPRTTPAFIFVLLLGAAFVGQLATLHRGAPYGIANRIFVLVLLGWLTTVSLWLRQVACGPVATEDP